MKWSHAKTYLHIFKAMPEMLSSVFTMLSISKGFVLSCFDQFDIRRVWETWPAWDQLTPIEQLKVIEITAKLTEKAKTETIGDDTLNANYLHILGTHERACLAKRISAHEWHTASLPAGRFATQEEMGVSESVEESSTSSQERYTEIGSDGCEYECIATTVTTTVKTTLRVKKLEAPPAPDVPMLDAADAPDAPMPEVCCDAPDRNTLSAGQHRTALLTSEAWQAQQAKRGAEKVAAAEVRQREKERKEADAQEKQRRANEKAEQEKHAPAEAKAAHDALAQQMAEDGRVLKDLDLSELRVLLCHRHGMKGTSLLDSAKLNTKQSARRLLRELCWMHDQHECRCAILLKIWCCIVRFSTFLVLCAVMRRTASWQSSTQSRLAGCSV